jgi:D-proline reductase (dithiol) PrdB
MAPIEYIPRTRALYSSFEPYRWVVNEDIPWTPLTKPLNKCRVALASSAGVYHKDQIPFHTKDDTSLRQISKDVAVEDLRIAHFGYRTDDAKKDPNCVFPIERMRELEAEGFFGELAERAYSFMGGIYSARRVRVQLAPRFVELLFGAQVDLLYIVPA